MTNKRVHIQRDFSGGAISSKMMMRQDTDVYKKSALAMRNFLPSPQGSAIRAPGTRYVSSLAPESRIIPYLTPGNDRSLVVLGALSCDILFNINDLTREDLTNVDQSGSSVTFRKRINRNQGFRRGLDFWEADPGEVSSVEGFPGQGVYIPTFQPYPTLRPRLAQHAVNVVNPVYLRTEAVVDTPTDILTLMYQANYAGQWAASRDAGGGYKFTIRVSEDPTFATTLYEREWNNETNPDYGSFFYEEANVTLPTPGWTGTLYAEIEVEATATSQNQYSTPIVDFHWLKMFANGESTIEELNAPLVTPYTADDLQDVQYVQSPYSDKEIVFTHPRHPPQRLRFDSGLPGYVWEAIPFTNAPGSWAVNNYPLACTSFGGRLVLGGGSSSKTLTGDPLASVSETVWATKVGLWSEFSLPTEVDPDDSIEFTSIYRSPIQWVYGQKNLMIGSQEFEYAATASQINAPITPGDVAVFLQTTHGSKPVQPAGFGSSILFASDAGTKVRSLSYSDDNKGWVALDLTLYNPEICSNGVVRMVRQRHPHQMCLALLQDGTLSIFHSESGIDGWSTYSLNNAQIKDVCVVSDDEGIDVPYFVVNRFLNGTQQTSLECIPSWIEKYDWDYSQSTKWYQFETPVSVITGLSHLEGKFVFAYNEQRLIGVYQVSGGEITLSDGTPNGVFEVINVRVGLMHRSILTTLPPQKLDPGAKFRYSDFAVRVVNSTRPIINGERPPNRDPGMQLGFSQVAEPFADVHISSRSWGPYNPIEISEQVPFRCEVVGIYGTMKEGTVS